MHYREPTSQFSTLFNSIEHNGVPLRRLLWIWRLWIALPGGTKSLTRLLLGQSDNNSSCYCEEIFIIPHTARELGPFKTTGDSTGPIRPNEVWFFLFSLKFGFCIFLILKTLIQTTKNWTKSYLKRSQGSSNLRYHLSQTRWLGIEKSLSESLAIPRCLFK